MPESMSPMSLNELEQLLKSLNERLTYLEKVVLPSRVTKEELHSGVWDAKLHTLATLGSIRSEVSLLKQQMATKGDLEQLQQALLKEIAALRAPARMKR